MISLKDYAKDKGISYEAVRQQVKRYRDDLEGHISRINRTQYLDEEAVAFLDERRQSNPVVVYEAAKDEEIEALKAENKALLLKLTETQERLLQSQDKIALLQEEKIALLEEKTEPARAPEEKETFWSRLWHRK